MAQPDRSTRVADVLRENTPPLDDVARARGERALLGAVAEGHEAAPKTSSRPPRRTFAAGVGVGLVAAAAVLSLVWFGRGDPTIPEAGLVDDGVAVFEAVEAGEVVGQGAFVEGETVQTAVDQSMRVAFGRSRIEVGPYSHAVFERLDGDVRVRLRRGVVDVAFHPAPGEDRGLAIVTALARVEVVGTEFRVLVDPNEGTMVEVRQGTVRVVPLPAGEARLVHAGESFRVSAPQVVPAFEAGRVGDDEELSADEVPEVEEAPTLDAEPRPTTRRARLEPEALDAQEMPRVVAPPARPLADDVRFDLVEGLIDQGRYGAARRELYSIARSAHSIGDRARSWSLVGDTYQREGNLRNAAEAYSRASAIGFRRAEGRSATFALARTRERQGEGVPARTAYQRYLELAPSGVLAGEARRALCRLGDETHCEP